MANFKGCNIKEILKSEAGGLKSDVGSMMYEVRSKKKQVASGE